MGRPKMSEEEKLVARQKRAETKVLKEETRDLAVEVPGENNKESLADLPETKQVAYSIAKDSESGRWHVIKIMYDLASGTVSSPQKLGEGDDRSITFERFKIEAGTAFMGEL